MLVKCSGFEQHLMDGKTVELIKLFDEPEEVSAEPGDPGELQAVRALV